VPQSEDCLTLNVCTWCGITAADLATALPIPRGFDGTNLPAHHDIVAVSVHHRLNILGFMYLAELGGAEFAHSGNASALDMLASQQWVRDNIERFGGDPAIRLRGQSQPLLAMPAARGLFHRAMVMSGAAIRLNERKRGAKLAKSALSEVGLRSGAGRRGGGERIGRPTPPPTGQHLFSITNGGATTTTAVRRGCCGRRSRAFEDAGRTAGYSLNLESAEAVRAWRFARRGSAGCLIHFHGQFQKNRLWPLSRKTAHAARHHTRKRRDHDGSLRRQSTLSRAVSL
jgi:hypothetical protein